MATTSMSQDNFSARLYHLLARWSLIAAVSLLLTTAIYLSVGNNPADSALGREYAELMRAIRSPGSYRVATGSEVLYWLMIGGTLLLFAGLFARRAPIRAMFIAACGIGQLVGSLGGFVRLTSFSDLAARYAAAASNQQTFLLQSFLNMNTEVHALYGMGSLLQGAGYLLVAWAAWRWTGFPRWLAILLVVPGLLALPLLIDLTTGTSVALFLALDTIGLIIAQVAIAVAFWRPSSSLVSTMENKPAVTM